MTRPPETPTSALPTPSLNPVRMNGRGRKHHAAKNLPLRRAEASRGVEKILRRRLHAVARIDEHWEYCAEDGIPMPNQIMIQRQKRDPRRGGIGEEPEAGGEMGGSESCREGNYSRRSD